MAKRKIPLVCIIWIDSTYWDGSELLERPPMAITEIRTVGWLYDKDDKAYYLATDLRLKERDRRHLISIPRVCVKKVIKAKNIEAEIKLT